MIVCMASSSESWEPISAPIFGTLVPVEEPSTASQTDLVGTAKYPYSIKLERIGQCLEARNENDRGALNHSRRSFVYTQDREPSRHPVIKGELL